MESVRLSQQWQEFFHTEKIIVDAGLESVTRLLQIVAEFFCGLAVPSHWRLLDIERDERAWHFRWRSHAEQAPCPHCHVVSRHLAHRYTPHTVQDLPLNGMTVYHTVIKPRYVCDQTECPVYTFVDPIAGFTCPRARLSTRLKTLLIRLSLPSVINRMPAAL
ncbi:MAG: transposase family protein [Firmicutes bacterium]|nr:transposase family protein [Bacillota bacterium]